MKTAEEWAVRIQNSKEPWEKLVQEIQMDAMKEGMTIAAGIARDANLPADNLQHVERKILDARDRLKK